MKQSNDIKHNILVIGDSCVDKFVYCRCARLSPEAPVPVLDILRTTENLGMAGNVKENIESINGKCEKIFNQNYKEIIKTRYVEDKTNHMFVRIDEAQKVERIPKHCIEELAGELRGYYDAIVISDYDKGFLLEEDIELISSLGTPTFMDTKKTLGRWASYVDYIKINRKEYAGSLNQIKKHKLGDNIIETLGEEGCSYQGETFPVKNTEVKDLAGAGDSFLAALVVNYLSSWDIKQAISFANHCATQVVKRKGVTCIQKRDVKNFKP
jgi:D-glycero-beta-D-manno-heptose-7-phosphate kinase